jgi:hypothetical protein
MPAHNPSHHYERYNVVRYSVIEHSVRNNLQVFSNFVLLLFHSFGLQGHQISRPLNASCGHK